MRRGIRYESVILPCCIHDGWRWVTPSLKLFYVWFITIKSTRTVLNAQAKRNSMKIGVLCIGNAVIINNQRSQIHWDYVQVLSMYHYKSRGLIENLYFYFCLIFLKQKKLCGEKITYKLSSFHTFNKILQLKIIKQTIISFLSYPLFKILGEKKTM